MTTLTSYHARGTLADTLAGLIERHAARCYRSSGGSLPKESLPTGEKARPATPNEIRRFIVLHKRGMGPGEIATATGFSRDCVYRNLRKSGVVPVRVRRSGNKLFQ